MICLTEPEEIIQSVPKKGSVHAIVIYVCGNNATTYQLPEWYDDICDTNYQRSIPNYFKDMSFGQHMLTMTPVFLRHKLDL